MEPIDRLFLRFALCPPLKVAAFLLLALAGGIALPPWGALAAFAAVAADIRGALLAREFHPAFREDLQEIMTAAALGDCGVLPDERTHSVAEASGSIDHWLLRKLPDTLTLALFAPKRDFVVIAERSGRIFPPAGLSPLRYAHEDLGSRDVYYSDVTSIELRGGLVRLHMTGGEEVEYEAEQGGEEVVADLRQRLREFKSRA